MRVEIATMERLLYSGTADMVLAPGVQGQLGILPHHAPLLTRLSDGELLVRCGGEEHAFAICGGFMDVQPDRVIVLADVAEAADEIDVQRAQAARQRAAELVKRRASRAELIEAEAALRRSLVRLHVAQRRIPRVRMGNTGGSEDHGLH